MNYDYRFYFYDCSILCFLPEILRGFSLTLTEPSTIMSHTHTQTAFLWSQIRMWFVLRNFKTEWKWNSLTHEMKWNRKHIERPSQQFSLGLNSIIHLNNSCVCVFVRAFVHWFIGLLWFSLYRFNFFLRFHCFWYFCFFLFIFIFKFTLDVYENCGMILTCESIYLHVSQYTRVPACMLCCAVCVCLSCVNSNVNTQLNRG